MVSYAIHVQRLNPLLPLLRIEAISTSLQGSQEQGTSYLPPTSARATSWFADLPTIRLHFGRTCQQGTSHITNLQSHGIYPISAAAKACAGTDLRATSTGPCQAFQGILEHVNHLSWGGGGEEKRSLPRAEVSSYKSKPPTHPNKRETYTLGVGSASIGFKGGGGGTFKLHSQTSPPFSGPNGVGMKHPYIGLRYPLLYLVCPKSSETHTF